jgi:hypothetical protein
MWKEMNDLDHRDAVLGYRMLISWGALEPTPGHYDFSVIDAALARLKNEYDKPKRLAMMLVHYSRRAYSKGDVRVIPAYIQDNPIYGASPISGSYGWWGKNEDGASTGMYAPALYFPPVMDRYIALIQALGKHLDGDPNFEALYIQEGSAIVQAADTSLSNDPHYSDAAFLDQLERLLAAATEAFPHTNIVMANVYFARPQTAVALTEWMAANRIAAGSADSLGQSAINSHGYSPIGPGLQALLGETPQYGGGVDLRPMMTAMMEVESGDMSTNYFKKLGGPFTPIDIIDALNHTYHASHAFWTRMVGDNTPVAAQWGSVAASLATHPLIRTEYPANYPTAP